MAKKRKPIVDRRACDDLWRKLVKAVDQCQRCGSRHDLEAAHLIPRRFAWTRTDTRNGRCLCRDCHRLLDAHAPGVRAAIVSEKEYDELWHRAHDWAGRKFDWAAERVRLKDLAKRAQGGQAGGEAGLSTLETEASRPGKD